MFKTIRNAFKVKELRGKILYTFMMLVVIRFGCQLPIPGIETSFFANWFAKQTTDVFGFFNAMTGGSFSSMSIFALSITPYITSSIIIQLLTIAIPALERMAKEEGEEGQKKIARITRYTTVGLGLLMGWAYYQMLVNYASSGFDIITEQGFVPEEVFLERLPEIAKNAIGDACTGSNPRQPSQEEMEKLLKCCYYDTDVDF